MHTNNLKTFHYYSFQQSQSSKMNISHEQILIRARENTWRSDIFYWHASRRKMKFSKVCIRLSSKETRILNKKKYQNHRFRWDRMAAAQPTGLHHVGSDMYLGLNAKLQLWYELSKKKKGDTNIINLLLNSWKGFCLKNLILSFWQDVEVIISLKNVQLLSILLLENTPPIQAKTRRSYSRVYSSLESIGKKSS